MARKIVITIVASLLTLFLIFLTVRYAPDILHSSIPANEQSENATTTKSTEQSDSTTETTLPADTTVPETKPAETKPLTTPDSTKPQGNESTVIPADPTENTTQPSKKPQELPKWKQMYISQATVWRTKYDHFALVYIDGDDIPELYMYGNNLSELCVFRNDAIYSLRMNGMGGGNYQKKSGRVLNVCAEDEYLAMYVYELTDVFRRIFYGREDKSVNPPVYYIGEYTGAVSEAEFKAAVSEYIDTSKTTFLHENALTYDAFLEYVTDF